MGQLEEYCLKICCINGLDTYIISPAHYDRIIEDAELSEQLRTPEVWLSYFVKIALKSDTHQLYPAFVCHQNRLDRFKWELIHCYKKNHLFYHVCYRDSWMCRECGYLYSASIIMPIVEADTIFYSDGKNKYPHIPLIFHKVCCPKCGKYLQNHLIVMDTEVKG